MATDRARELLDRAAQHDEAAALELWNEYSPRVAALARVRLPRWQRCVQDEEDTVSVVFQSLFAGLTNGSSGWVRDSEDLWKLLLTITRRTTTKQRLAADRCRYVNLSQDSTSGLRSSGVEPAEAVEFDDLLQDLLRRFPDTHRSVLLLCMEGHTTKEIASELSVSLSTVMRRLRQIRGSAEVFFDFLQES